MDYSKNHLESNSLFLTTDNFYTFRHNHGHNQLPHTTDHTNLICSCFKCQFWFVKNKSRIKTLYYYTHKIGEKHKRKLEEGYVYNWSIFKSRKERKRKNQEENVSLWHGYKMYLEKTQFFYLNFFLGGGKCLNWK